MTEKPLPRLSSRLSCSLPAVFASLAAAAVTAVAQAGYTYDPSDFAVQVIEYVEGTGIGSDALSGQPFSDPTTALGRPAVDTTGEGWNIPPDQPVPVVAVYPAFRSFEIVTIGNGGGL